jgi:hypothetical protein
MCVSCLVSIIFDFICPFSKFRIANASPFNKSFEYFDEDEDLECDGDADGDAGVVDNTTTGEGAIQDEMEDDDDEEEDDQHDRRCFENDDDNDDLPDL